VFLQHGVRITPGASFPRSDLLAVQSGFRWEA
jgi:hypothetical protein